MMMTRGALIVLIEDLCWLWLLSPPGQEDANTIDTKHSKRYHFYDFVNK